MQKYLT